MDATAVGWWLTDVWFLVKCFVILTILTCARLYMRGAQYISSCRTHRLLDGKLAVITGGSGDIAQEVALELVMYGCDVLLACRDMAKGWRAKSYIEHLAQVKRGQHYSSHMGSVTVAKLDLLKFSSVHEFARWFGERYKCVDVLINCAGVMFPPYSVSEDGWEEQWQVNYLSHFLLSHLMLQHLARSEQGRIINLTAQAHFAADQIHYLHTKQESPENKPLGTTTNIPATVLAKEAKAEIDSSAIDHGQAFVESKLAVMLFTKHFPKILKDLSTLEGRAEGKYDRVTVHAVHPGICRTSIMRHLAIYRSKVLYLATLAVLWALMKTAADGAQCILYAAISEECGMKTGKYWNECRKADCSPRAKDEMLAAKLYDDSKKMCRIENVPI